MNHHRRSTRVWHQFSRDFTVYLYTHMFIRNWNEPYLPLPSQPQLVLIYRPWRDGRLSRPWCEVAQAEIRTHNLPIANPALYHTATSTLHVPKQKINVRMGTGTLVLITIKYRCSEMYYYACTPRKLEYTTFKSRLNTDTYWQNQEIIYDFRAQLQGTRSRSEAV